MTCIVSVFQHQYECVGFSAFHIIIMTLLVTLKNGLLILLLLVPASPTSNVCAVYKENRVLLIIENTWNEVVGCVNGH